MNNQIAICVNCEHCILPDVRILKLNYICSAYPKTEAIDFVTGEKYESLVLCASKNPDGTCEKFTPKG